MEKKTDSPQDNNTVSAQVRGETLAYAMQSGAFSILANLYEPSINMLVQKRYAKKYNYNAPTGQRYGSYGQNLAGELVGDLTGAGSLILAEAVAPEELHRFTRGARKFIDPLFESVAHIVFCDEAHLPGYENKVEQWKLFHERNLVRSGIIASTGMAGNLITQKLLMKNPSPSKVIFLGKALSTSITTALGLTMRFAFPDKMKGLDSWISKKYLAPKLQDKDLSESNHSFADRVHTSTEEPYPVR